MTQPIIWSILQAKKLSVQCPYTGILDNSYNFGHGELGDALGLGFSFVEHEDHLVQYVVASRVMIKRIFREIDSSEICCDEICIGKLWTAQLLVSDRIEIDHIIFSNEDYSVVLDLNLNNMNVGVENANIRVQV